MPMPMNLRFVEMKSKIGESHRYSDHCGFSIGLALVIGRSSMLHHLSDYNVGSVVTTGMNQPSIIQQCPRRGHS
jgi:hypothetical protein